MTPSLSKDQKQAKIQATQQPEQELAGQRGQGIEDQIAEIAYYKSESRGFTPGYELNDWLDAEQELALSCQDGGS